MKRRLIRPLILGAFLICASARPAHASGHALNGLDAYAPLLAVLVILGAAIPSEFGAFVPDRDAKFLLGWAWQVPLPMAPHHRIIGGVDYIFGDVADHARGRIGYRYDRRYLIGGVAAAFDNDGMSWSPEVGVKFLHFDADKDALADPSLHVLVRANVAATFDRFIGLTILLGWSIF